MCTGCEYALPETEFDFVDEPVPGDLDVDLISVENDTILLINRTTFQIALDYEGTGNFYEMAVWLGDAMLYKNKESSQFTLSPSEYSNGFYALKVRILYSTTDGPLRNKLEPKLEEFVYNWIVQIDNEPPQPVTLSYEIKDGQLKLLWSEPLKDNFTHFTLSKKYYNELLIIHKDSTSFIDKSFTGNQAEYTLAMISENFEIPTDLAININAIENFAYEWTGNNMIHATWDNPVFYNSIEKVEINGELVDVDASSIPEEAVTEFYTKFGARNHFIIRLFPKESEFTPVDYYQAASLSLYVVAIGEPFPQFKSTFVKSNVNNSIYITDYRDTLQRLNFDGNVLVKNSAPTPLNNNLFDLSHDGTMASMAYKNILRFLNPMSLEVEKEYTTKSLFGTESSFYRVEFMNENLLQVQTSYYTHILDPETKELAFSIYGRGIISPDGKYYITFSSQTQSIEFYEISGNSAEIMFSEPGYLKSIEFLDEERVLYVVQNNYNTSLIGLNLTTNQRFMEIQPASGYSFDKIMSVNKNINLMVVGSSDQFLIVDYSSGQEIYTEYNTTGLDKHLLGDKIVSGDGSIIDIDELIRIRN